DTVAFAEAMTLAERAGDRRDLGLELGIVDRHAGGRDGGAARHGARHGLEDAGEVHGALEDIPGLVPGIHGSTCAEGEVGSRGRPPGSPWLRLRRVPGLLGLRRWQAGPGEATRQALILSEMPYLAPSLLKLSQVLSSTSMPFFRRSCSFRYSTSPG